jgi:predicted DNA binding protein
LIEYLVSLEHDLPFNNVSKKHPTVEIDRWCNGRVDYVEVSCENAEECAAISKEIRSVMAKRHPNFVQVFSAGSRLNATIRCSCTPATSTLNMAEQHNLLWQAPVRYKAGTEIFTLIAFSNSDFEALFDEYEALGKVKVLKKIVLPKWTLRDTISVSLESLFSELTPKQLDIMLAAVNRGYYDIPRGVAISTIASEMNLSPSTIEEHLSKAEMKLSKSLAPYLRLYHGSLMQFRTGHSTGGNMDS